MYRSESAGNLIEKAGNSENSGGYACLSRTNQTCIPFVIDVLMKSARRSLFDVFLPFQHPFQEIPPCFRRQNIFRYVFGITHVQRKFRKSLRKKSRRTASREHTRIL
ncbi:MAG: hypothetical protein ACOX17_09245 [Christensenellales bacterium]